MRQPHKMVKHAQTICRRRPNADFVFSNVTLCDEIHLPILK